jgi:hypothetical protein
VCQIIVTKGWGGGVPVLDHNKQAQRFSFSSDVTTMQSNHTLFLTKHLIVAPLIWHLIINLSRSVAEVSDNTDIVYLCHTYMYSYAPFQNTQIKPFNVTKHLFYYFKNHYKMIDEAYDFFLHHVWNEKYWPENYFINALRIDEVFRPIFFIPNVMKKKIISFIS